MNLLMEIPGIEGLASDLNKLIESELKFEPVTVRGEQVNIQCEMSFLIKKSGE